MQTSVGATNIPNPLKFADLDAIVFGVTNEDNIEGGVDEHTTRKLKLAVGLSTHADDSHPLALDTVQPDAVVTCRNLSSIPFFYLGFFHRSLSFMFDTIR